MARRPGKTINAALIFSLMLALVLSANTRLFPHDPLVTTVVVALHDDIAVGHDHSHTETDRLSHTLDGHAHDAADHDHNPAFLDSRKASGRAPADSARLFVADNRRWHGPTFEWDRPPRG